MFKIIIVNVITFQITIKQQTQYQNAPLANLLIRAIKIYLIVSITMKIYFHFNSSQSKQLSYRGMLYNPLYFHFNSSQSKQLSYRGMLYNPLNVVSSCRNYRDYTPDSRNYST